MTILLFFLPISAMSALAAGYLAVFIEGKALQLDKDSMLPTLFRRLLLIPYLEYFVESLDSYIGRNFNKLVHLKFLLLVVSGVITASLCLILPQVAVVVMVLVLLIWLNHRGST
jgi:hypothetical protein